MALFLYLAGLLGACVAWVYLFVQSVRGNIQKEASFFGFHLAACLGTIFILWLIMVYPSECTGLFCEVAVFLVWIALCSILFFVWPLILLAIYRTKTTGKSGDDNLIDN